MINDDNGDCPQVSQQPRPYHVVLVDLKKAAQEGKIYCVEKPLMDSGDLKYVAISYRWGELQETTVDTGVGYLATITSFHLSHFTSLCRSIATERDLQHMDYIWIDAICVDQTNYERRKTTIYQMTNIYERANYIVAVPDLHLFHVMNSNRSIRDIIHGTMLYREYIYHLIQGNTTAMMTCDQHTLDEWKVPEDPKLRYLLTKYTDHFTDGFIRCRHHDEHYDENATLDHIFQTNPHSHTQLKHHHARKMYRKILHKMGYEKTTDLDMLGIEELHHCDKGDACPLYLFDRDNIDTCQSLHHHQFDSMGTWQRRVPQRSNSIRKSMTLLADLIEDWSRRVWVISEYHIAKKKKNKMKYWFIQLGGQHHHEACFPATNEQQHNVFFEFDFHGKDTLTSILSGNDSLHRTTWQQQQQQQSINNTSSFKFTSLSSMTSFVSTSTVSTVTTNVTTTATANSSSNNSQHSIHKSHAVSQKFHETIVQQLNQQTFLEKILKSKSSRSDDRFHAILPSSEYKDILTSKDQVDRWNIYNLISVKLQLYEWMNTKHKLELLFLSTNATTIEKISPTFATSPINWPKHHAYPTLDIYECNFDLNDPTIIQLFHHGSSSSPTLHIRPFEYFLKKSHFSKKSRKVTLKDKPAVERLLQLDPENERLDKICIPNYIHSTTMSPKSYDPMDRHPSPTTSTLLQLWRPSYICLIGSRRKNKWILKDYDRNGIPIKGEDKWERYHLDQDSPGFIIY